MSHEKFVGYCLLVVASLAIGFVLHNLRAVFVPFGFASCFFVMVAPIAWKARWEWCWPMWLVRTAAMILGVGSLVLVVATLWFAVGSLIGNLSTYTMTLDQLLKTIEAILTRFGYEFDLSQILTQIDSAKVLSLVQRFSAKGLELFQAVSLSGLFFVFYILGMEIKKTQPQWQMTLQSEVTRYIWIKTIVSFVTAACVFLVFKVLDLRFALTFSLLVLFLNYIPSIGSIIATMIPLPVAFMQYGFDGGFWVAFLVPGILQFFIGSIVDPKLMGKTFGFHPITILLSLLIWGSIWGISGMFLAMPAMIAMKLLAPNVPLLSLNLEK